MPPDFFVFSGIMERLPAKIFLFLFIVSASVWQYAQGTKGFHVGELFTFGTIEFRAGLDPGMERSSYASYAEHAVIAYIAYPFVLLTAAGFLRTTRRSVKEDGWLLMSAILLFMFVPVELFCFWRDWKIVGLHYWGDWPLEEFRKAVLLRVTAMAGLPFIAQLCYYTIPLVLLFKPFRSFVKSDR